MYVKVLAYNATAKEGSWTILEQVFSICFARTSSDPKAQNNDLFLKAPAR